MIEQYIQRMGTWPSEDAVIDAGGSTSYLSLLSDISRLGEAFRAAGIPAGAVVAVEAQHSAQAGAALLALADLGAVCVPMTRLPEEKRKEFLDVGEVEWLIEVSPDPSADPAIQQTGVHASHALYASLREQGSPGLVLFSSGTTGRSKASVLDFTRLLARYQDDRPAQRILSFLNLDHIGGINTLLHTLGQGGTVVTVEERTPDAVLAAIARHRVNVLPTTPTFLTMLLISGALERHDVSSLTHITYGTEPMPEQTLRRLAQELPSVRLKQTYGLSELGILGTKSRENNSLWVKLGGEGFDYKIIDDVLWIRSRMAMLGYLNAEAPFDDEGYFNTQDVVRVDGEWLQILGRRSEIINVAGEKVYPNEVESVLLEMENVLDVTVSGIPSPVTGQVVQAALHLVGDEGPRELRKRVEAHCRDRMEPYKIPAKLVVTSGAHHSDRFKKVRA
ncbi:ANL family adenylate-forming protein [Myceligenerans indicum]|uniref:Long-chain fatty acid--CoA ligase n=1 Tax=Myceligenerans indicum TaxID=2593663 RepID=A0ABS1LQ01_9MICO|nr:fatty acid--CoA ligase family protein [Myceligenerans indicum]MBL0888366.1 long-chain fatty acid--CoA ligase [Myceligenerans indicum]